MADSRFNNITAQEVNKIITDAVPENTSRSTKFAVKLLKEWLAQQDVFMTPLEDMGKTELSKCLERFSVSQTKRRELLQSYYPQERQSRHRPLFAEPRHEKALQHHG